MSGDRPINSDKAALFFGCLMKAIQSRSLGAGMLLPRRTMHTCLDQYNANKAGNGNGSLKWIQKGGGYYSECNKRLSSSQ
jgi:hypothetical protein